MADQLQERERAAALKFRQSFRASLGTQMRERRNITPETGAGTNGAANAAVARSQLALLQSLQLRRKNQSESLAKKTAKRIFLRIVLQIMLGIASVVAPYLGIIILAIFILIILTVILSKLGLLR